MSETDAKPRVFGVLQDISELTAQRAAAEDRALFAEQMVGIVSHDLRNPLSTIGMGAEVLSMMGVPERQQPVLDNIQRASKRALRLINDLLDFTRARLGQGLALDRLVIGDRRDHDHCGSSFRGGEEGGDGREQ